MGITEDEKKAIVSYRIEKAKVTIKEATTLTTFGYWNLVANRLYYATFYAVTSLLIHRGFQIKTHSGVQVLFNQELVQNNILSLEERRLYSRLFQMRQTGDYDDCFDWDKEDVEPLIQPAENLISKIYGILYPDNSTTISNNE